MSTRFFNRPTSAYTGEAGLTNRTKYNDDSTASPRRPISSTKVDGDFNYLIDAVNTLYDTAVSGVVADNSITDAKLRDSAGLSVIGRSANSSGNPGDIVAANDGEVLRRSGTSVGFGQIDTAGITDSAVTTAKISDTNVTFAKIQNVNTATIVGRSSSGAGPVEALTVGTGLSVSGGAVAVVDASETVKGVVEIATTSEIQTGTDNTRAISPAGARAAFPFSRGFYESSEISLSNGSQSVLAHGLGIQPRLVTACLRCKTSEFGYSVNDEVIVPTFSTASGTSFYLSTVTDATNITIRQQGGFVIANKGSSSSAGVTLANWALIIRAFA